MKRKRAFFAALAPMFAVAAITAFSGCDMPLAESDVPYVTPMLDNVLAGIAENDYGKFSKDFSEPMKAAMDAARFPETIAKLEGALGKYRNKTFLSVKRARAKGRRYVITKYMAAYEKADTATLTVYITDDGGNRLIEGFAAVPTGNRK